GVPRATILAMRGFMFSVIRLITPPLPAASRPSKMTTILSPCCLTHSCSLTSSICSLPSSSRYSLFDILVLVFSFSFTSLPLPDFPILRLHWFRLPGSGAFRRIAFRSHRASRLSGARNQPRYLNDCRLLDLLTGSIDGLFGL